MIAENGARTVTSVLKAGQMTIFPTASIHTMMNIGCENAQLIAALNSDDSGTTNLANAFFSLPANITNPIVGGGPGAQDIYGRVPAIGTGSNFGPDQCRAACAKQGKMIKHTW
jgi:oxalate decarboxylase/phosphoglucose isomerase-like protein (cupin superfamily)